MNSNKQSSNSTTTSKNNEEFIKKATENLKKGVEVYAKVRTIINNTPIQIRIINIVIPFTLTYIFTYIYFNLSLSILFALITFFFIFIMSKIIALIFIVLYIVSIVNAYNQLQITIGKPFIQTDIVNGTGPWISNSKALTIKSNQIPQDLQGGYFSYSFWLYVKDTNYSSVSSYGYRYNEWKSIFYRGVTNTTYDGLFQYPGFWLSPKLNNLVVVFQETGNSTIVERIELNNIPINQWFNIACVVESKSVSLYINGLLDRTLSLNQSIKNMNNYDLNITSDSALSANSKMGFDGSLAELIFFNYALTPADVYNSYLYYLPIITTYQNKLIKNNYNTSSLITNSDYNELCGNACNKK